MMMMSCPLAFAALLLIAPWFLRAGPGAQLQALGNVAGGCTLVEGRGGAFRIELLQHRSGLAMAID